MQFKRPKNTDKYYWTDHSVYKMMQYGLSAQRIIRIIRAPHRTEKGIVSKTIAVMQPTSFKKDKDGKRTWGSEIWAMYQIKTKSEKLKTKSHNSKLKINKFIQNSKFPPKADQPLADKIQNSVSNQQLRIISAWRYPGVSPENNPIPEDILDELEDIE